MSRKISEAKVSFDYIYEEYMKQVEQKTGLQRHTIYGVFGIVCISFILRKMEIIFTYAITMIYPLKWTYEDYCANDEDLIKMWGSYWGIFGFFTALDLIHKYFIAYVPLYFFIRTLVLLWMYLPCFKGAIIFHNIVFVELFKLSDLFRSSINEKDSMLYELKEKLKEKNE